VKDMAKKAAKKFTDASETSTPVQQAPPSTSATSAEPDSASAIPKVKPKSAEEPKKIRLPAEELHKMELLALAQNDTYDRPINWNLSPRMAEIFISGSEDETFPVKINGNTMKIPITTKFFGDKSIIQKAIVTLASERSLMLIGEPGTAKSWLSEHLAAGICGKSTYLVQGTAGTTEDQIRYSWNYALLVSEGPSEKALVPSPTILAMKSGKFLRFEELTRCPQEIQDSLISIISEKVIPIPELGSDYLVFANQGFNIIATANDRDRGVNEMSAALKRRFNFIYLPIIQDRELEKKVVSARVQKLMENYNFSVQIPEDTLDLVVNAFQELRTGKSDEGGRFQPLSTVMSTSEEISLLFDCAIYSNYFGKKKIEPDIVGMNLVDATVKDDKENIPKLVEYMNLVAKPRSTKNSTWKQFYTAGKAILKSKAPAEEDSK
jgi:MoxR-like ATPase